MLIVWRTSLNYTLMCTSPIAVRARTSFLSTFSNAKEFTVPCGECLSCQYDYGDQWSLRLHYEIRDCLAAQGVPVFVTLTYRNEDLPYLPVPTSVSYFDEHHFRVTSWSRRPCFSYDHVKVFLRELRRSLPDAGLRFFITGEYGSRTSRPHYHGILFFSKLQSQYIQRLHPSWSMTNCFKSFIQEHWPYGHCRWSHLAPNGPGIFVKDGHAGSYVSKYVCKCVSMRVDLRNDIRKLFYDDCSFRTFWSFYRKQNAHSFCRHYQSMFFGDSLLGDVDFDSDNPYLLPSPFHIVKSGVEKKFPVSRYQLRKLTHDFVKDLKIWQLNDTGLAMKKKVLISSVRSDYKLYCLCCRPLEFCGYSSLPSNQAYQLSSQFVSELDSLGLSRDYDSFFKLFYYDYLYSFSHCCPDSLFWFHVKPSEEALVHYLDKQFYSPLVRSCDGFLLDSEDFPSDFLAYSDLFHNFVVLKNTIREAQVIERGKRDDDYKKMRDALYVHLT